MSVYTSETIYVTHDWEYPDEIEAYEDKETAYAELWKNFMTYFYEEKHIEYYIEKINSLWTNKADELKTLDDVKDYFYKHGVIYEFGYIDEETLWRKKE